MGVDRPRNGRSPSERNFIVYFDLEDERDATIVTWLQALRPRRRQEAVRNALYEAVRGKVHEMPARGNGPQRGQGQTRTGDGEPVEPMDL